MWCIWQKKHTVIELLRNSLQLKRIYKIFKVQTFLFKLFGFFAQNKVQYKKCVIQRTKDLNTEIEPLEFFSSNQNKIFIIRVKHTCTHSKYHFNSDLCV